MPARDSFHKAFCSALIKQGWTITDDPLSIEFEDVPLYIDLGAERLIAAEQGSDKIAVEIKSFLGDSVISEFHTALGQFLNYRMALSELEPERVLYLAVPNDAYDNFFNRRFAQRAIAINNLRIIVYNSDIEEIIKWQ
ncbi:MAG: fatty-acid oxidation protein subunit alpha [Okeania sp. SIO3B5]|uniref:XisH family protein n=1 Tax=Okeania sp. SIO3B5 TaxID=2607811 RepID=UPI0013FF3E72|nr:XisH family protein [Okeania sp. SIO3B5]NEO56589.1 fatty-acid oxidation protein subunit alpha [Okeania sp. SIO3B5]